MSNKDDLLEALERLKKVCPQNIDLIQRVKDGKQLKINKFNVEKEASKSNGILKNYPEIREEIEKAELERLHGEIRSEDERRIHHQNISLQKLKKININLDKKNKILKEELARKDELLKLQIEMTNSIVAALWAAIPPYEIEQRTIVMKKIAEVIKLDPKQKKSD